MPSQGMGGYAMSRFLCSDSGIRLRLKRDPTAVAKVPGCKGSSGNRPCAKMMTSPVIPINVADRGNNRDKTINPTPKAPITSKMKRWKPASKNIPKFTTVNSSSSNQMPRFIRNFLVSTIFLSFWNERKAEVPARKTKMGAHKCVIQRVKKRMGVVVDRLVGLSAMESTWIRSRTWSSAMMIITSPLVKSML